MGDVSSVVSGYIDFYASGYIGSYTTLAMSALTTMCDSYALASGTPKSAQSGSAPDSSNFDHGDAGYISGVMVAVRNDTETISDATNNIYTYRQRELDTYIFYWMPNKYLPIIWKTFSDTGGSWGSTTVAIKTVWYITHNDRFYEIVRPVPKFVNNQLVYWYSDMQFMSEYRDPFTKEYDYYGGLLFTQPT